MNKAAEIDYLKQALTSLLVGGGLYAGARGLKDLSQSLSPNDPTTNELNIVLPKSKVPKKVDTNIMDKYASVKTLTKKALLPEWLKGSLEMLAPAAIGVGGVYGGWKGAQGLHSHLKNKEINNEEEQAKNDYMKALQAAAQKTASCNDTPLVDSFLTGMLQKKAWSTGDIIAGAAQDIGETAEQFGESAVRSTPGKLVGATLLGTAGLAGLASYYLANRMDRNKAEATNKSNIPTEVKLHVR